MQLKIINNRVACRGRPPTRGVNRDGPGTVGSSQFVVGGLQSVFKPPGTEYCHEPGKCNMQHVTSNMFGALVVKRRSSSEFRFKNSEFRIQNSELGTPLARDWPIYTHPGLHKKPPGGENHIADNQSLVRQRVPCDGRACVVKRRWGDTGTVGSWQLAVSSWQLAVGSQYIEPLTADRRPPAKARDWPIITCSAGPNIIKNRHKHRWRATGEPADGGGKERVCMELCGYSA